MVWLGEADSIDGEDADAQRSQRDDDRHFYVPAGTTAPDTLLITSLIGRIPKSGQVTSPMPFKALVGAAVLVAPGENLPQLRGAVLQGEAVGDLLLSCVRAQIHSATLIAADGSYMQAGDGDSNGEHLGYLSDPVGNPCIPGQLISDFPRTLLGGVRDLGARCGRQRSGGGAVSVADRPTRRRTAAPEPRSPARRRGAGGRRRHSDRLDQGTRLRQL